MSNERDDKSVGFVPLSEDEIERVRSVYKRHFSDSERLDIVCDMALASLSLPSPCGHPSQYVYSEDGGAHIVCLLCERSARSATAFMPTHRHADGGLYRFVAKAKYKAQYTLPGAADWTDAVIYKAEDGKFYVTTPARWADRFTAINRADGGGAP